ncbi:HEAT repeat domain-containing protein [Pseudoalteromonas piscicida]|uniref:HEAT repeat domain-containing protein n=1 Tax=Pseudoalteromonas piscicida TaxID=43662 RepID=A0A2A5JSI9_PSEO7|nr:HEAT repeat domain-containing protein [Pseudoalteromonas piscicida]PCK32241.1 hypothetical protein CEX98_07890 [Pseudoalteromonas piscicida]
MIRPSLLGICVAPWLALLSLSASAALCQPQFSFNIKTATSFNYSKLNHSAQQTEIELAGQLSVLSVTKGAEQNWWAIKADNVVALSEGDSTPLPQYELPFAFKLDNSGLITEFYFSHHLSLQAQEQLKGLAFFLQYQNGNSKIKPERDNLGEYRARYKPVATANGTALLFSKLSYELKDPNTLSTFSSVNVLNSAQEIIPSACFLDKRAGAESLELSGTDLKFHSQQDFDITKVTQAFPTSLFMMDNDLLQWPKADMQLSDAEKSALTKRLLALVTEQDISQIDAHTLALLLREFDAVIGELSAVILTSRISDKAQMRLFNALGQLDTPASQHLLSGLLVNTKNKPQMQFRALRALTQGQNPLSDNAANQLIALLNDGFLSADPEVVSSFYMTLGIILNNRSNSAAASRLDQAIVEHITLSDNDNKTADLITALGNSRNNSHVPFIDDYLQNSNARIEKAAIRALGMVQSRDAYRELESHLSAHSGRNTKALITALGHYQMTANVSDSVLNFAVNNSDEAIRYAAIKALSNQQKSEGIKATLRQALQQEHSRRNFEAIVNLLHSNTN